MQIGKDFPNLTQGFDDKLNDFCYKNFVRIKVVKGKNIKQLLELKNVSIYKIKC